MALAFFYYNGPGQDNSLLTLDEDNSRHIVQVLRMQPGNELLLSNGEGLIRKGRIEDAHKKHCTVSVVETNVVPAPVRRIAIAISLLKNANRFEWFLEKATELGITEIIPLICERTESEKFKEERLRQICISAMLQSQQAWLPRLHSPQKLSRLELNSFSYSGKWIAHCLPDSKVPLSKVTGSTEDELLLIGPEGDFTETEIEHCLSAGFVAVALGDTRLRTETAAIVGATLLRLGNKAS